MAIKVTKRPDDQVRVTFVLPDDTPPASVVGNFNDWDPYAHPMRKRSNGTRSAAVQVEEGTELRFRYLLEGDEWRDEPEAARQTNEDGTAVSVVTV